MKQRRCLITVLVAATAALGLMGAPTAGADCTSSGATTVCAHGDARGANSAQSPAPSPAARYPASQYPCNQYWDQPYPGYLQSMC